MDKLIGNTFLLIAMARKTKRTLTRAELKKIKRECKEDEEGREGEGKSRRGEEGIKEERARHESPKGNQEVSIINQTPCSKIAIPEAGERVNPGKKGGSEGSGPGSKGLTRSRRSIPGGVAQTGKPMYYSCKTCHNHAKRHTFGQTNQGGYLMGNIYNSYSVLV